MAETFPPDSSDQEPESNVPRRQLGRRLTSLRERAGMSTADAARLMDCSRVTIWRYENGMSPLTRFDVKNLGEIYGASPSDVQVLIGLAVEAKKYGWHADGDLPDWYTLHGDLERIAAGIFNFEAELIPGLLQTRDYSEALFRSEGCDPAEMESLMALRQGRQQILDRRDPPNLEFVLNEAVLYRAAGSRETMAHQLAHLVFLSGRETISIRVLPFSAGIHRSMMSNFSYLRFREPNEPNVVYVECRTGALYLDRVAVRKSYREAIQDLRGKVLSEDGSRELIAAKAREYME